MQLATSLAATQRPVMEGKTPLERKCLEKGLRLTYARRTILSILAQAEAHLTADEIYRHVLKDDIGTTLSVSSIYGNTKVLVEAGVIEVRKFQSRQSYYSSLYTDLQDQLIDTESGQVIEFRNAALDKLKAEIAKEYGYSVADCRVELYTKPCLK